MGPVALFDKSFLQSLSIDEAVWFDHFFIANISPLFYVETLADLEKEMKGGRTAEQVVGNIAEKSPQLSGAPNISHFELMLASLMGDNVSMKQKPVIGGGAQVISGGKKGMNFEVSLEAKAFSRWQDGEYQQIEREFARSWRQKIKSMSFDSSASYAKKLGIDISSCKNMDDAAFAAKQIVTKSDRPYDLIAFIVESVGIPREYHQPLVKRLQFMGKPSLRRFAPYAAHVVEVEVFFHICISRGFISSDRPSNKIDIAYLHYLPFCHVFVSGDKLHRSTAKYYLENNQRFVWGPDLKTDLSKLNARYLQLPEKEKERGVLSFASKPPFDGNYLTSELWDLLGPNWRKKSESVTPPSGDANDKLLEYLKGFTEAPPLPPEKMFDPSYDLDSFSIKRSVRRKRGSWYQVPKDLEND